MLRLQYQQTALSAVPPYVSEGAADRNIWKRNPGRIRRCRGLLLNFTIFEPGWEKG